MTIKRFINCTVIIGHTDEIKKLHNAFSGVYDNKTIKRVYYKDNQLILNDNLLYGFILEPDSFKIVSMIEVTGILIKESTGEAI